VARWKSLRIMLLQVVVSTGFAWGLAVYANGSITYAGFPNSIESAFRVLSFLVPTAYQFRNATTGNEALVRDFAILVWTLNLIVGVAHFVLLTETRSFLRSVAERLRSLQTETALPRAFRLLPIMLLSMSALSLIGASALPVLINSGSTTYPDVWGLTAQACGASVLCFSICNLIALHAVPARPATPGVKE
jgi:xanthine/uracil/vitamin C permease (AzgA family)